MKRLSTLVLLGSLIGGASGAMAMSSQSINQFPNHVLPVLVQVNSQGRVTGVSPSDELPPRYARLLRQTLDEMITRPANNHGRPVASQFVMNLALQTSPRPDGQYDARFVYVSASPVPAGSWYWEHIDGHRLALRRQGDNPMRFRRFERVPQDFWRPEPAQSAPPMQNARPAASPASGVRPRQG